MSGEPELEFANSKIEGHLEFIEVTLYYNIKIDLDSIKHGGVTVTLIVLMRLLTRLYKYIV